MPKGALIIWVLSALVSLAACTNAQKTERLDLTQPRGELGRTSATLDEFVVSLEEAIEYLNKSSDALMELDTLRLRDPFPVDVFKHTLISCLNLVDTSGEGPPELVAIAKRFGVTCPVPAIAALDRKLERGSPEAIYASGALKNLDTVRQNRNVAQQLLRTLPDQLARTTAYIGARKSELRKTRQRIKRRKSEYRPVDFRATMKDLDAYGEELALLEDRVFEIEAERSAWTSSLGKKIDSLYKALTTLGEQPDEIQRTEAEIE